MNTMIRNALMALFSAVPLLAAPIASANAPEHRQSTDYEARARAAHVHEHATERYRAPARSPAEREHAQREHARHEAAERFRRADHDHDGFLTRRELGEARWERWRAADLNRDGRLTSWELDRSSRIRPLHR